MRILITGGNGFLGSNLVEHLADNNELLVLSRSDNNIKHILNKIKYISVKEENYYLFEQSILDFNPEIVIHCAWQGGNSYADINNLDQVHKNVPLSLSLLEIINKQPNKAKFIGFGSFVEYGFLQEKAIESQIEKPVNFYGLTKNIFKRISELYCEQNNIYWLWIRPCYVYGPRDVPSRLIPSIINKILRKEELILNSCDTIIDYMYIDDFCKAVIQLINSQAIGVYNICSGEEYSLKDIITTIKDCIDTTYSIKFDPVLDRKFSSKYVCGSNAKLVTATQFNNSIKIKDGILQTIQYNKKNKI